VVPSDARTVADVGAVTGKLTSLLVGMGLDVIAVEPSSGMRSEFARVLPGIPILAGSGEQIPLPDSSVDTVLFGQSWHWVDPRRAAPEVARVLRPGGRLGLLWNLRDESVEWVGALGSILATDAGSVYTGHPIVGPPFGEGRRSDVGWSEPVTRSTVLDLVATRSYIITLPVAERKALLDRVGDLVDSHPDLAGRVTFSLPYITQCWTFELS